jgi:hypothetical protein
MPSIRTTLASPAPASRLLRQVLLFAAVDVVFIGFSLAYAHASHGLAGALLFLAAQYLLATVGFVGAFVLMRSPRNTPARLFRAGVGGMLLGMLAVGATGHSLAGLACLALAGGGRGVVWGARTWLEMHHTKGASRETYLALLQSAMTAFKLAGPLVAAGVMYASGENFQVLFATIGVLGFAGLWALRDKDELPTPVPGPARPLQALLARSYWSTAPFYITEGAGAALRQALFVSGTLAVVTSVSAYGVVDALSSLAAALCLVWLARHPGAGPSLRRLQGSLALVAVSWLFLLGALQLPVLLAGFVAAYAFGTPLLATVKSSLVLKGLTGSGGAPHDNAMARQLILALARLGALALAALLAGSGVAPETGLAIVVGLVLLVTPLEYHFAKKLVQRTEAGQGEAAPAGSRG